MSLTKKIDFAVIIKVKNANPNGDPLNGNRPRTNYDNLGEISDVCIKRKIRDRLAEAGHTIFVQSDDSHKKDEHPNLIKRYEATVGKLTNLKEIRELVCSAWFDVRAFGQVFPFKGSKGKKTPRAKNGQAAVDSSDNEDKNAVSMGIRGPVSIHSAFSIAPVDISSNQIVKSTSLEGDGINRQSDQMGMKHRVDKGIYVFYGSINPQLAERTLFSDVDAEIIKEILPKLFENDASSARPEGSIFVSKVFWWEQPKGKKNPYPSFQIHDSLKIQEDGTPELKKLEDLEPEVIDGFK